MNRLLWLLLLLALSTAHAENILGKTTPFSKSQACQQVKCKLLSETKVGPYVVYTYTGKTADPLQKENPEYLGRYFAIKRNEVNVALGVYYRNAGGAGTQYDERFALTEVPALSRLLALPLPRADRLKGEAFRIAALPNILLSNRSAMKPDDEKEGRAFISFAYAVTAPEAEAVARLLNREDLAAKNRLVAQIKRDIGAYGACRGNTFQDRSGKPFRMNAEVARYLKKWVAGAEERGMVWARATGFPVLTMPGLSSTTVEVVYNDGYPRPWPGLSNAVCLV